MRHVQKIVGQVCNRDQPGGFYDNVGRGGEALEDLFRDGIWRQVGVGREDLVVGQQVGVLRCGSGSVDDRQVWRVEQEHAHAAAGGPGIDRTSEVQVPLARHFDEPAVSRLGAAACVDVAVESGRVIGPNDDSPRISGGQGVGRDPRGRPHGGEGGGLHVGIVAAIVAADQHSAAAGVAGDVDAGISEQADAIAQ